MGGKSIKNFFSASFTGEKGTSLSFLGVFETVRTEAMFSFKLYTQQITVGEQCIEEQALISQERAHAPRGRDTK